MPWSSVSISISDAIFAYNRGLVVCLTQCRYDVTVLLSTRCITIVLSHCRFFTLPLPRTRQPVLFRGRTAVNWNRKQQRRWAGNRPQFCLPNGAAGSGCRRDNGVRARRHRVRRFRSAVRARCAAVYRRSRLRRCRVPAEKTRNIAR